MSFISLIIQIAITNVLGDLQDDHGFLRHSLHTAYTSKNVSSKHHNWYSEPCTFLPQDESPLPTILISLGRSGSSVTWQTIAAMLNNRNIAYEFTGQTYHKSNRFFHDLETNPDIHYDWALKRLCYIQNVQSDVYSTNPGIAGFQWKPYTKGWNSAYGREARRLMAQSETAIKIIYLVRNPLDVKLSNLKHKVAKSNGTSLGAHCPVDNQTCIHQMIKYESGYTFPVGNELLSWLNHNKERQISIQQDLTRDNLSYVKIDYNRLYSTVDNDEELAEEWMKVFRYLGRGPMEGLTMKTVRKYFVMAPSHSKSKNETIRNFQQVVSTLKGTEFEHLLRE